MAASAKQPNKEMAQFTDTELNSEVVGVEHPPQHIHEASQRRSGLTSLTLVAMATSTETHFSSFAEKSLKSSQLVSSVWVWRNNQIRTIAQLDTMLTGANASPSCCHGNLTPPV